MPDSAALARAFAESYPADAARTLESIEPRAAAAFVAELPPHLAGRLLDALLPTAAAACLRYWPPDKHMSAVRQMGARAVAGALRSADTVTHNRVLDHLSPVGRAHVGMILRQPLQTIGAWVETRVPIARTGDTVAHARERLAGNDAPDATIYVLDAKQHLIGVVSPATLVPARADDRVDRLMEPAGPSLSANDVVDAVIDDNRWGERDTLPVVDAAGKFVGSVRHADLRRALNRGARRVTRPGAESPLGMADMWCVGLATMLESSLGRPRGSRRETEW